MATVSTATEWIALRSARRGNYIADCHGLGQDAAMCATLRAARESLLLMCAGDALAMPLHWYYSQAPLNEHRALYKTGAEGRAACRQGFVLTKYRNVLPALAEKHPDSCKYFAQCRAEVPRDDGQDGEQAGNGTPANPAVGQENSEAATPVVGEATLEKYQTKTQK